MQAEAPKRQKGWIKFWAIWAPLFAIFFFTQKTYGLLRTLPVMFVLLLVTLLYQRFVNKRSWNAIMWGNKE